MGREVGGVIFGSGVWNAVPIVVDGRADEKGHGHNVVRPLRVRFVYRLRSTARKRNESLRNPIAIVLALILAALIYLANFAWWMDSRILDEEAFVESAVDALAVESSRDAVGQLIVDRLVDEYPLLVVIESNLVGLFSDLLDSPTLTDVLEFVAVEVHERITSGNQEAIVIDLVAYRDVILGPVEAVAPGVVDLVPDDWFASIEILEANSLPDLSAYDRWVTPVILVSVLTAAALVLLIIAYGPRRGLGLALAGTGVLIAGLGTAILVPGARALALQQATDPSVEVLVSNVYSEFTGYLKVSTLVFVVLGVGFTVAGLAVATSEQEAS